MRVGKEQKLARNGDWIRQDLGITVTWRSPTIQAIIRCYQLRGSLMVRPYCCGCTAHFDHGTWRKKAGIQLSHCRRVLCRLQEWGEKNPPTDPPSCDPCMLPCRLSWVRYAHGCISGMNMMVLANHFLIGFKVFSTG